MADLITACIGCYNLIFENCGEDITLPTGLAEGTEVAWHITDKFGNLYGGDATVDADGNIIIDTTEAAGFPAGLFTPHSGTFTFEVNAITDGDVDVCEALTLTICEEEYKCIDFSFASSTEISTPPSGY